ncbi:MAG: hypothetical protein K6B71_03250 [Alphaproteobacteria bacterium]|nr:hypothetical protein [Alphaproteobacteria bacterium]
MQTRKDIDVEVLTTDRDRRNLEYIEQVRLAGRIDDETAEYLTRLYSDGMKCYRDVFHVLGKTFGAPKAAVTEYDPETDSVVDKPIKISDINPLSSYLVNHRLDADPMRNQFFTVGAAHRVDLSVSSIVTVIVAAQKSVERAIDKVTGKYYQYFIEDVMSSAWHVISDVNGEEYAQKVVNQIRDKLSEKYTSNAAEVVLELIDNTDKHLVVNLVRELDAVKKPYRHLNDVWRVKCLFDLIPQARTFIERIYDMMPERVLSVRDKFYDISNPRNYRDSKVIVNIGTAESVIPMEIICQVRTFFEFERKTHEYYAMTRANPGAESEKIENKLAEFMEDGIKEYNLMICRCLDDLFDRVGWNILYSQGGDVSMFEGFPRECKLYYPPKVLEIITNKLDAAVRNEIFHITNSSSKLDKNQQNRIFRFMARFILVSALPYTKSGWTVHGDSLAVRLFNFVMNEIYRYYSNESAN